jgi:hypothetical protein
MISIFVYPPGNITSSPPVRNVLKSRRQCRRGLAKWKIDESWHQWGLPIVSFQYLDAHILGGHEIKPEFPR